MKVKSPKSGYMITVGGKAYKNLEKEGYFGKKIKSPKTNRYININGSTYNNLYKEGFFKSFTGLPEIDKEILIHLSIDDIKHITVNQYFKNLIQDDFWCQWLYKNYNIIENKNCKEIAKALSLEVNLIYDVALTKGYTSLVKYLLDNKVVDVNEYKLPYYTLKPVVIASANKYLDIVKLLLSYGADPIDAFYASPSVDITTYILENYKINKDYLSEKLSEVTRDKNITMMKLLINYGADPSESVIAAIHSNDIDILKYILSYNPHIPDDTIAIALGLRKYEMLQLILDYMAIDIKVTHNLEEMEKQLLPYINDEGVYGEVKYKWY